jgi:hypothetical protein
VTAATDDLERRVLPRRQRELRRRHLLQHARLLWRDLLRRERKRLRQRQMLRVRRARRKREERTLLPARHGRDGGRFLLPRRQPRMLRRRPVRPLQEGTDLCPGNLYDSLAGDSNPVIRTTDTERTEDTMARSRSLLFCTAILALVAISAGTGGASALSPLKKCGTFKGAAWTVAAFGKKGTTWKVVASGTPCSFALTWAIKLEKIPFHGEAGTRVVGPTGWACLPNIAESRGTSGSCQWPATSQATKQFGWGPSSS